jgi:hypothetical protein
MIRQIARATWSAGACVVLGFGGNCAGADALPKGWQGRNVDPIGYVKLDGPRAFKLSIARRGERWYLFVGQGQGRENDGEPGFDVVDVSEPTDPRVVTSIHIPAATGQISLHGNLLVVGEQMPFSQAAPGSSIEYPFKGTPAEERTLATFWDVTDPRHPVRQSEWRPRGYGTHRNVYPGGAYAFMSAWLPGYRGQSILAILDVSDPKRPREAGRWWWPGQREDETPYPVASGYHGPANLSSDGRMLTLGYTPAVVNLDVSDIAHPKLIGSLVFSPLAAVGTQAIHTVIPLPNHFLHVSTEPSAPGCKDESAPFAAIVDNSDPAKPRLVAYYPRPRPPEGVPYASFCAKGGRFGPHNVNAEIHSSDAQAPGELIFMTYFTAGLRVFDISDPNVPFETGWFLPEIGAWSAGMRGPEDVLVDARGMIYTSEGRGKGVWVLKYAGPRAASLKRAP